MKQQTDKKVLIFALSVPSLLAAVGTSMANLSLPAISHDFGIPFSKARWVVLSYLVASTIFSLFVGLRGDRSGRKKVLAIGTVFFFFGAFVSGLAPSFWILALARLIQGMGAAALLVMPVAIATEILPIHKTGRVLGLMATMSAIGTASGPSVGGAILTIFDWRTVFFLMAFLGLLNFSFIAKFIPRDEVLRSESISRPSFLSTFKAVYADFSLRTQLFANLTVSSVMMSTLIVGPFYLTHALKLGSLKMGLVMSIGPVTSMISGIFSGYAVDRFGSGVVARIGFVQLMLGTISFIQAPQWFGAIGFAISAMLLSVGYQLFLSANSKNVMTATTSENRGLISGALTLSRNLGLIGGTFILGSAFDFVARASDLSAADPVTMANGLRVTFSVATLFILYSLIRYLKIEKRRSNATGFID
jgi:MFS family permease